MTRKTWKRTAVKRETLKRKRVESSRTRSPGSMRRWRRRSSYRLSSSAWATGYMGTSSVAARATATKSSTLGSRITSRCRWCGWCLGWWRQQWSGWGERGRGNGARWLQLTAEVATRAGNPKCPLAMTLPGKSAVSAAGGKRKVVGRQRRYRWRRMPRRNLRWKQAEKKEVTGPPRNQRTKMNYAAEGGLGKSSPDAAEVKREGRRRKSGKFI